MFVFLVSTPKLVAQAGAAAGESSLMNGMIELPFAWVGAFVGLLVLGILLFWARRLSNEDA